MAIKNLNIKVEEQKVRDFKKFAVLNNTDMSKLVKAFMDDLLEGKKIPKSIQERLEEV